MKRGFSLIETLVVIAMFAIVAAVVSQSTAVSLRGSKKSDASAKTRENLSSAIGVIERRLRGASEITTVCDGVTPTQSVQLTNQDGVTNTISCNPDTSCTSGSNTYVLLDSDKLTSTDDICITKCDFVCTQPSTNLPPTIEITIQGQSKDATGIEDTSVEVKTSVTLRAY